MDIERLIQINKTKKDLSKNRDEKIRKKLVQANKARLASDKPERQRIPVHIKSKMIEKKSYRTIREKERQKPVVLQENVDASTFIYKSEKYSRMLEKTKVKIAIDTEKVQQACQMLYAYASTRPQEKNLYLKIVFNNQLKCILRPVQIEIPYCSENNRCILITKHGKTKEQDFREITRQNFEVYSLGEFNHRMKDQTFKNKALKATTRLFCDFKIYKDIQNSPLFHDIISKNVIFPIEGGKVPHLLKEHISSYAEYIEDLSRHAYFLTKSQKEYMVRISRMKQLTHGQLVGNIVSATHQIIARLFEKNKMKDRQVEMVQLKTDNSVCLDIYP